MASFELQEIAVKQKALKGSTPAIDFIKSKQGLDHNPKKKVEYRARLGFGHALPCPV
jgi:hypothetical protein